VWRAFLLRVPGSAVHLWRQELADFGRNPQFGAVRSVVCWKKRQIIGVQNVTERGDGHI
jgi:hypothetical protein